MKDLKNDQEYLDTSHKIAIIGMSGQFPGADSIELFWSNLCNGIDSISHFSDAELEDSFDSDVRDDVNFVKARPILNNVDKFDAEFFGMYAREAELTDPQQRVFLECAWNALEDGGYDPARASGPIGVFGGASMNTYLLSNLNSQPGLMREFTNNFQVGSYNILVGNGVDFLATRTSYKLDLKGPSINVQSACSTSLLAITQACQSLNLYQCDMAIAGGVSISFPQKRGYMHQEGGMVSSDGRCRSFDAQASGTVFGSGAGVVLLKRFDEAVADGDHIYATILGCGVNNDGADKVGFTAPSVNGQAEAISLALAEAEVDASSISYVECHGTATPLGDPIEIAGLSKAFRQQTEQRGFCAIGSVKSNVGHLDSAAGVTGLIKTALAMQHKTLPPMVHFKTPNPRINIEESPFYVNDKLQAWQTSDSNPLRAGVSAFGVGGTNVHVVMEEAPKPEQSLPDNQTEHLFILSARTDNALGAMASNLATHIEQHPDQSLSDISYTLMEGRRNFDHRAYLSGSNRDQLVQQLRDNTFKRRGNLNVKEVVFMFPGQGSQYPDMGRELYSTEPVFKQSVDQCADYLKPLLGVNLLDIVYPSAESETAQAAQQLMNTVMAQAAIFTIEFALAKLWISRGVTPSLMIGHSVGEWVAAVIAEIITLPEALAAVAQRGQLMQDIEPGCMLSVAMSAEQVTPLLDDSLSLAAINSPTLCVVAGPQGSITELEKTLKEQSIVSRRLHTSHAFHSSMMDPVIEPLSRLVASLTLQAPKIPIISCVTGDFLSDEQSGSNTYWAEHARRPVNFAGAIECLLDTGRQYQLLEVGPGDVLATLARQCARGKTISVCSSLGGPDSLMTEQSSLLQAYGQLWSSGMSVNWQDIHSDAGRRVSLPTYPFERRRYWVSPNTTSDKATHIRPVHVDGQNVEHPENDEVRDQTATNQDVMAEAVLGIIEDLSGETFENISDNTTFVEMGFDSLFLTQVVQQLQRKFKTKITFRQLLGEYSTITALADFLEQQPGSAPTQAIAATSKLVSLSANEPSEKIANNTSRLSHFSGSINSAPAKNEFSQHIKQLVTRCDSKMRGSKQSAQAHRKVLADPRAVAGFKAQWKELVYPIIVERSQGAKLWDIDGNEYIDLVNGYGQTLFGHAPDFVVDAVKQQLDKGFAIGPQAECAGEVASLFAQMTGNERVTFCNTGSEAVMAAIRLSRQVTGKDKIVTFNGDYHGQFDEVLVKSVGKNNKRRTVPIAGGIPAEAVANVEVLDYGSTDSLLWIQENLDDIAAVIVEPIQSRSPHTQPFEFLRELRRLTESADVALVFDEVVTGFRVASGGIQAVLDIEADLVTYGKVVGGGMPIGVLAGKSQYMDALDGGQWQYQDESVPEVGVTFFAGTFVRHPLTIAAVRAVLHHLEEHGPTLQQELEKRTQHLVGELRQLFEQFGLDSTIEQYSSWFYFDLHREDSYATLLYYHLRELGIHIQDGFPCFLTTAHSSQDLQTILDVFRQSLQALTDAGIIQSTEVTKSLTQSPPSLTALTESQMEIWLTVQMGDAASCVFNESISLNLNGALNEQALRRSLEQLVMRHDALRSRFAVTGEHFTVANEATFDFEMTDLSTQPSSAYSSRLEHHGSVAFDLIAGPLLRAELVTLAPQQHRLILTSHHIVCDGWSFNVIVEELGQLYEAAVRGGVALLPAALQFSTYASTQESDQLKVNDYWRQQFLNVPDPLALPKTRQSGQQASYRGASISRKIDRDRYRQLKETGAKLGSTLFATLLGSFQLLVGRISGQSDVVVAVPTAGQTHLEQTLLGHCVHLLPIRGSWTSDTRLSDHLKSTSTQILDAYDHQQTTLGSIIRELGIKHQQGRVPLAQVQFNLERLAQTNDWPELAVSTVPNPKTHVNFDLFLNIIESDDGLRLDCDYSEQLFDASTVDQWLDMYEAILQALLFDPSQPACQIACLPAGFKSLLTDRNATHADYPNQLTLDALLQNSAIEYGHKIAVSDQSSELSFADVQRRANQLANHLLAVLPRRNQQPIVAIATDRSCDTLVAMLAVMKAGAAFLPLDPSHPEQRRKIILEDAAVSALISNLPDISAQHQHNTTLIELNADAPLIDAADDHAPVVHHSSEQLAYIIYTSGSTGKPKGVCVSHRSVVNFLSSMAKTPGLTNEDSLLAVTTISFDISILELFLPLLCGARLVIASEQACRDGFELKRLIEHHDVTTVQATPASWQLLLAADFASKGPVTMLCGGEHLPPKLADELLQTGGELWNMYGPTETTIWSSCNHISDAGSITIGKPINNTQFHVLDPFDQLVMPGSVGQLHIGGLGLSEGYLNRDSLTQECFIDNPFGEGKIYRTGDYACQHPNGEITVLGRIDTQAKVRGFRVELGEIESALGKQDGIAEAVVVVNEQQNKLIAYYVQTRDQRLDMSIVRTELALELPDYMIPTAWQELPRLPRLANGKLDYSTLPEPQASAALLGPSIAPSTKVEIALANIVKAVLALDDIGMNDDLLALGADSIQLFKIVARAVKQDIPISASQLVQSRTLVNLCETLNSSNATKPTKPARGRIQKVHQTTRR